MRIANHPHIELFEQVEWEIDTNEIDFKGATALGKGAYGEVVKARWRGLPVAIKRCVFRL